MDTIGDLRTLIVDFRADMNRRFDEVDRRFEQVDRRFEQIDRRFESVERRFEGVDRRFEGADHRSEGLDQKLDRHFMWLVGTQIATLVATIGWLITVWSR